ncbi:MAG: DNA modification methylase [Pedobacter sp.]|nr:MAG: DNA modification methylase [Pedobacter sp.]
MESEFANVNSYGVEAHSYIYRIARTKLNWDYPADKFKDEAFRFLDAAKNIDVISESYPKLITDCFPPETLVRLGALKRTWLTSGLKDRLNDFIWFIITSILRSTSPVGTAQWQYIQPNKTKSKVLDPFVAFEKKVNEIYQDMLYLQSLNKPTCKGTILNEDARNIVNVPNSWGDLVITSPPYANNYDYADATRLEMMFWGDITGWSDLQGVVRSNLVRACTQHVSKLGSEIDEIISEPKLSAIKDELVEVYNRLKEERLNHGGKKNYHLMIAAYFSDLAEVFLSLRRVTKEGVLMCFVIGDSAPYGIYVPVDRWLGELAISAGFKSYTFEKLRDRNTKWKNRKHTVPLHEGRLWIKG